MKFLNITCSDLERKYVRKEVYGVFEYSVMETKSRVFVTWLLPHVLKAMQCLYSKYRAV
jgi:hypothetical protein